MRNLIFLAALSLGACTATQQASTVSTTAQSTVIDGKLFASVFQQKAAEYKALCFQAYNIARLRLDAYKPSTKKTLAIITDLDETLLDNSKYQATQSLQNKDYDAESWLEWTNKGKADTVPGSASFFKYAASKGVEIFYITNRSEKERQSTLWNLQLYELPNTDEAHLFTRATTSSKEERRQKVLADHEIVLLVGDNLADFSSLFDKKTTAERLKNTNISQADFGSKFIILPNPVYGDWESSLYNYNYKLTPAQKDSAVKSVLKGY
jgi:5'-nucleotidase (lipoprotein e(P4) family)